MSKIRIINGVILFVCLVSITSYAQFGIKLGANMSKLGQFGSGEEYKLLNSKFLFGGQGGIYFNKILTKKLSIGAETLIQMKGETYTDKQRRKNYLSIPLLLNFEILNGVKIVPGVSYNYSFSKDFRGLVANPSNFDVILGLKIKTSINTSLEFRYDHGLNSIEKTPTLGRKTIQTQSLQLFFNYDLRK